MSNDAKIMAMTCLMMNCIIGCGFRMLSTNLLVSNNGEAQSLRTWLILTWFDLCLNEVCSCWFRQDSQNDRYKKWNTVNDKF